MISMRPVFLEKAEILLFAVVHAAGSAMRA